MHQPTFVKMVGNVVNKTTYSRLQLLYLGLRQGEVQIIVGNMAVPLPVYFIYLQYAVCIQCGRQFIDSYESKGYSEEFKREVPLLAQRWRSTQLKPQC
ncbi:hypothetical protein [Nostoc sp.]|uniref:hypothetical protein n=1 Tax=Nostoc sp. TaxID=1180 RepID=UPI002FF343EE